MMIVGMSWRFCSINPLGRKIGKLSMLEVFSDAQVVIRDVYLSQGNTRFRACDPRSVTQSQTKLLIAVQSVPLSGLHFAEN